MRIIAIGKAKPTAPEALLFIRYAARINPKLTLVELNEGTGNPLEIKRREAETISANLAKTDFAIALDQGGETLDSATLAKRLTRWAETGRKQNFIIGGAEGLDATVINRADAVLSLGALTWPHMLARIMLAEQIYRAQTILSGHPYHRGGRP